MYVYKGRMHKTCIEETAFIFVLYDNFSKIEIPWLANISKEINLNYL